MLSSELFGLAIGEVRSGLIAIDQVLVSAMISIFQF